MTNNPAEALRLLIAYAVCFSVALIRGVRTSKPVARVNVVQPRVVRLTRALPA